MSAFKYAVVTTTFDLETRFDWKQNHAGCVKSKHRTFALALAARTLGRHIVVDIDDAFLAREQAQKKEGAKLYNKEIRAWFTA